jgi:cation:H+ antiporter
MATALALPLFLLSLAVTLAATRLFARRLDRLGARFGFPEALVGLLSALAADGPEISSALIALAKGAHSVGVGVLVGSNAFNLAAMIGVSGLLAGSVRLSRDTLLLEGAVGVAITLLGAAVLLGWVAPVPATILAGCVIAAYLLVVIGGSELLARRLGGVHPMARLAHALEQRPSEQGPAGGQSKAADTATHHLVAFVVLDVVVIVAASAGMVQGALALGENWHVSSAVLGMLVLAPLTSIPNAVTGVRLGLAGRSAALVGETFNSNSLNLGAGVIVPSLFIGLAALSATAKLQLAWLVGMTVLAVAMLAPRGGMRRPQAVLLILLYCAFVAIQLS